MSIFSTGFVQDNYFNIRQRSLRSHSLGISRWALDPTHFYTYILPASVTATFGLTMAVIWCSRFSSQPPVGETRCWTLVFYGFVLFSATHEEPAVHGANENAIRGAMLVIALLFPLGLSTWLQSVETLKRSAVEDHDNDINGG